VADNPNRRKFISTSTAMVAVAALTPGHAKAALQRVAPLEYDLVAQYGTSNILGYTVRTRTYGGKPPGPMIETAPGQTLTIRVINNLPVNPPESVPSHPIPIPLYSDPSMGAMERRMSMRNRANHRQRHPHAST
jgi:FtsP/CotA-like multicopper oxidase with cupredoxin domain